MAITIIETTSNSRVILTAEGTATDLDELWVQIPATYKTDAGLNFYVLTGNVSLILNCQLAESRVGIRAIVLQNGATIAASPTANLTTGKTELINGNVAQTGLVVVGLNFLDFIFSNSRASRNENAIVATLLAVEIEQGWSFGRMLKMFASILGGKIVPGPNKETTIFRNISDTANQITSVASATSDRQTITYSPDNGIGVSLTGVNPLYSETLIIPDTPANTDVVITTIFVNRIIFVSYIFAPAIANTIRVSKAEVNGNQITLRASQQISNSRIILIGEV